ncbi:hypothetical protein HHK36_001352 [Tetracentron sinense]|uniref:RRM domain-containing protein n=1 Tax=Tetracentron sinense TaxID=13715 RepID=A0A835DRJ4_TETSI|nr:hypothetical protein HHK36_001352 [Tetracentron sinense]
MGDGYWRYGDGRQPAIPSLAGKRPRSDYDLPGEHELLGYFPRDDERGAPRIARDTESIGASYDRYLRNAISSYGGGESGIPLSGGMTGHPIEDPRLVGIGGMDPSMGEKSRNMGFRGGRPEMPLPPDASNTLFVEGLPANYIFRPFVGFREVRLVSKESRNSGGEPLVLCFVDFATPAHAATAMDALQGYKFDEHERDSADLRLQFARHPGPRSGGGSRGRR